MKVVISVLFLLLCCSFIYGQEDKQITRMSRWEDVKVYELQSKRIPDSLEICAEDIVEGVAKTMAGLNYVELSNIRRAIAKFGCIIVFVDLKNLYTSPGRYKLYILGCKSKN